MSVRAVITSMAARMPKNQTYTALTTQQTVPVWYRQFWTVCRRQQSDTAMVSYLYQAWRCNRMKPRLKQVCGVFACVYDVVTHVAPNKLRKARSFTGRLNCCSVPCSVSLLWSTSEDTGLNRSKRFTGKWGVNQILCAAAWPRHVDIKHNFSLCP